MITLARILPKKMEKRKEEIIQNITDIKGRIKKACLAANRSPESVKLLLATKTVDPQYIRIAIESGETLIGENKVQEFVSKAESLSDLMYTRHFIGHLQTNKIKEVMKYAQNIQTMDSWPLVEALDKRLTTEGRVMDIMVQVNTSFESSKFGLSPDMVLVFIKKIMEIKTLNLVGLMTIGLFADTAEQARPSYVLLKELGDKINAEYPGILPIRELSMGMSGDLEVAIEEGATMIRVGSAIFGNRL